MVRLCKNGKLTFKFNHNSKHFKISLLTSGIILLKINKNERKVRVEDLKGLY